MNVLSSLTTSSPACVVSAIVLGYGNVLYVWEPMAAVAGYVSAGDWEEFVVNGGSLTWNERLDRGGPFEQALIDYTRTHPGHPSWAEILSLYRQRFADLLTGPVPGMAILLSDPLGGGMALYGLINFDVTPFERARLLVPRPERFMGIVVFGHEHLAKPGAVALSLFLSCYCLQASNTLFVDDSAVDIEAVGHLGMRTHHFTGVRRLRSELVALGLLPTPDRH